MKYNPRVDAWMIRRGWVCDYPRLYKFFDWFIWGGMGFWRWVRYCLR